ncbi:MAG: hypothetical protein ACRC5T_03885 [Cetobacterium sp.]
MIQNSTHKLTSGFRGTFETGSMTAGNGVPFADPRLTVIRQEGFAPEGLDIVSNVSIAVQVNAEGYLVPANGTKNPYGILDRELLGTACMFKDVTPGDFSNIPTLTNGAFTNTETLHQIQPTVFQKNVLFETGLAFNPAGTKAALFVLELGDKLRPITDVEIVDALVDTLPAVKINGKVLTLDQLKAFYAGKLVKADNTTPIAQICGRVAGFRSPAQYDNFAYTGAFSFDYDLQGNGTHGQTRAIWNAIGNVFEDTKYTKTIVDFYATM